MDIAILWAVANGVLFVAAIIWAYQLKRRAVAAEKQRDENLEDLDKAYERIRSLNTEIAPLRKLRAAMMRNLAKAQAANKQRADAKRAGL